MGGHCDSEPLQGSGWGTDAWSDHMLQPGRLHHIYQTHPVDESMAICGISGASVQAGRPRPLHHDQVAINRSC